MRSARCRSSSEGSNNIYPKGALVLRMLRRRLGDERFWASMHLFLTRHQFGSAVTEDFRRAILDATGENLAQFWSEWMYRPGYPRFAVRAAYDSTQPRALARRAADAARHAPQRTPRGRAMPDVYHAPVTVLVGTTRGNLERRAQLDAREQSIVIDSLPGVPTMVVFDRGEHDREGAGFPAANRMARDAAHARSRPVEPLVGRSAS